jgi:prolyl-tRNA editing enzyme YbaK/EbsC (Cys-tRNA(Pro) deacylase)
MASTALERFTARAAERGIDAEVRTFPEGTRTAADAAAAIGCDVAQIVKSLVFQADGEPVLVLTSGANRVDEAALADVVGAQTIKKANAAQVREATGYAIGGTPPFGHDTSLAVVCDTDLAEQEQVWAAAGTPIAVFPLTGAQLVAASGATVAAVAAARSG